MHQLSDAIPGLHCSVGDEILTMIFSRGFDSEMAGDWAPSHLARYPGPFRRVRIDLSAQPLLTSMFYAGLMALHVAYTERSGTPMVVIAPDARTMAELRIFQLDGHFLFED